MEELESTQHAHIFTNKDTFIRHYLNEAAKKLNLNDDEIDELLIECEKRFKSETLTLFNSAKGEEYKYDMLEFIFEVFSRGHIISENGIFFVNQRDVLNPIIKAYGVLKAKRGFFKKKMLKAEEAGDIMEIRINNLIQKFIKIIMNVYYGASQSPTCKYFNPDLGSAITAGGRGSTSVSALTVESAFSSWFPVALNAKLHFITKVLEEKHDLQDILNTFPDVSIEDVCLHICKENYQYYDVIYKRLSDLSQYDLKRLFIKNNFKMFLEIDVVKNNIREIGDNINSGKFIFNPYSSDKSIDALDETPEDKIILKEMLKKMKHVASLSVQLLFGFYWYGTTEVPNSGKVIKVFNTEDVIRNIDRYAIPLIDTDSNMIVQEDEVQYLCEKFDVDMSNAFGAYTLSNILTLMTSNCVANSLNRYTTHTQVLPEYKHYIDFKNEFLYERFFLTQKKKNYVGMQILKEGYLLKKAKLDIKGLTLKKSNINSLIGEMVSNILENDIMRPEEIDFKKTLLNMRNATDFLREKALSQEGKEFFNTVKLNTSEKDTKYSDFRLKAVKVWNYLDLGEKITPPAVYKTVGVEFTPEAIANEEFSKEFKKLDEFCKSFVLENRRIVLKTYKSLLVEKGTVTNKELSNLKSDDKLEDHLTFVDVDLNNIDKMTADELGDLIDELNEKYETLTQLKTEKWKIIKIPNPKSLKIEDIKLIALPQTITKIPEFILEHINSENISYHVENLLSPIVGEVFVDCRGNKDRRSITNVIRYY